MSGAPRLDDPAVLAQRALAVAPEEREAFLDDACAGRPELRRRVVGMLDASAAEAPHPPDSLGDLPTRTLDSQTAGGRFGPRDLEGTTIAQYELGRRLGRGGMGVVHEARDTRLHRQVALKFLSLSLIDEPAARERFFTEARAASALDHNNICTIHEIGETDDGTIFIVMARYEGATLRELIGRGRLPVAAALDYGAQIAGGVAAAHEKGILHRDLKPANVMITEPAPAAEHGIAKILDFGVAKIADIELTRTGATLGTVAYMSPEQARGERVDERSDIWSLGVMLYEMLTGRRPFTGKTELAVLESVVSVSPAPPSEVNPEVPPELDEAVLKCLRRDREERHARVDDLLAELEGLRMASASRALTGTAFRTTARPAPRRRRIPWLGIALAAVLAAALAIPAARQALLRPFQGAPPEPRLVAVLPFINSLGESAENEALTGGLTHSLTGLVARLGSVEDTLWVVPASELLEREVATAGDARKLFGVDTVLTGSVQQTGARTEIILSVVDPVSQPPRTLDSRSIFAPLSPALRDRALTDLADLLGLGTASQAELRFDDSEVTSPAAYAAYLQGVGYLQRFDQAGNVDAAIEAFRAAVAADELYAPAHAGLCQALWDRYRQGEEAELTEQARASCDRAAELAVKEASVLVSVGKSYYEQGDTRRARAELERAVELEPDRAEAYHWLGWVEDEEARPEAAEAAFRKAIELEPRMWVYYNDLGITLSNAGRYREAAALFERSLELTPENYVAYNSLAVNRKNLNLVEEAERLYRRSIELQANPLAYRNLGNLYFREGDYARAVEVLEQARDLHGEAPSFNDWVLWSWLAHARRWAGDHAAAEEAWRQLIEMAVPVHEVNPKDADALMLLSDAHVALGEHERGRFYLSRLLALRLDANYTRYYIGRTYEMLGDRQLALDYLTQALEGGFDPLTVDRDPWLGDLRTEPGYLALRQQYLPAVG